MSFPRLFTNADVATRQLISAPCQLIVERPLYTKRKDRNGSIAPVRHSEKLTLEPRCPAACTAAC